MKKETNPFIITENINSLFFCERVSESNKLIKSVTQGDNIVVISPRQTGKTTLIKYCLNRPKFEKSYYTFYIDILHTSSLKEFTYLLLKEIYKTIAFKSDVMLKLFVRTFKSINGEYSYDSRTSSPSFDIDLKNIRRPGYTLTEIFNYLSAADKRCIIIINEFQQISKYIEKNIELQLMMRIRKGANTTFIYAGSQRDTMHSLFTTASRPFYNSSKIIELNAIPDDVYTQFVIKHFERRGKKILGTNIKRVYNLFKGHTYYMQKTFNIAFANTKEEEECTIDIINSSIDEFIASNTRIYREVLSNIPQKQKELLYAIAKDGIADQTTSIRFIKYHNLASASSVQSATLKLLRKNYISVINKQHSLTDKTYYVTDKLFAIWINTIYANGYKV